MLTPPNLDLALCYYDPIEETLKEFSTNTITIKPFERAVRRFYVINNTQWSNTKVSFKSKASNVTFKVKFGGQYVAIPEDFDEFTDTVVGYSKGLASVDVLIESSSTFEFDTEVDVLLEVV